MSKTVQGRNGAHSKASKRRKKQKNRLIIVVIEILVLLILAAVLFVTVKLSKIQKDTTHITSFYKISNGTNSIFHRDVRIDTCWLIEVNIICA